MDKRKHTMLVREALRRGDIAAASHLARIFNLTPVSA
jgi:hypothetical protein